MTVYSVFGSAVGMLMVTADAGRLTRLYMVEPDEDAGMATEWQRDDAEPVLAETRRQIGAYFSGGLRDFDLPLEMGGTVFQRRVWGELLKVPFGTTISYLELASRVGNDRACRAVGAANGRNPVSIIVPCHRVIGSGGELTGYGGGLRRKEYLIAHEAALSLH